MRRADSRADRKGSRRDAKRDARRAARKGSKRGSKRVGPRFPSRYGNGMREERRLKLEGNPSMSLCLLMPKKAPSNNAGE
jgi:hypothetical protein